VMAQPVPAQVEVRKRFYDGKFVVWHFVNRGDPAGIDQPAYDAFAEWEVAAVCSDFRSAMIEAERIRKAKAPSFARSRPGVETCTETEDLKAWS
jgi:hypothetical protein